VWSAAPKDAVIQIVAAVERPCNQHKVKGMQINYKSAEKYVGDDAFDLLVLFPAGTAWEVHYDVSVR
jgi:hypothetical protein